MNRNLPNQNSMDACGCGAGFQPCPAAAFPVGRALANTGAPRVGKHASRRAVALVVTLIMLSLITVITITILAIVRRDRSAAGQAANLTDARLATDAALERAKGETAAQILRSSALMGFDLTASRSIPTNVTELFVDPRVPVLVNTNRGGTAGPLDDRFFLDLNRNGLFENCYLSNGTPVVGDPQWIGLLEKPYRKHDANNRFTGRYAFIVVPCGKTLDVNWIHNMASGDKPAFSYFRNQGIGPWELNLAAFLADLNANIWGQLNYQYTDKGGLVPYTDGTAFADAKEFLVFRYAGNLANLRSISRLYGPPGVAAFSADLIDGYAAAPSAMGRDFPTPPDPDKPIASWSGDDSIRHIFNHQDFFDRRKIAPGKPPPTFVDRLLQAGTATSDYDRYTFYRMLAQLGTDSAAGDINSKIHLNYLTDTNAIPPVSSTNFIAWDSSPELSVRFFTTVADRLFQQQFFQFNPQAGVGITNISSMTNIMVSPTNLYSPAIHRIFQAAANIFDATRTDIYPSVFRPLFTTDNATNIFLTGFTNDNRRSTLPTWLTAYKSLGIPMVIGAKKDFPNFNEYTFRSDIQVTRKLEFVRANTNSPANMTNQMYLVGISNLFAAEAWNSYASPYPPTGRTLTMEITDTAWLKITNQAGLNMSFNVPFSVGPIQTNFGPRKFQLPLYQQAVLIPPSAYRFATRSFDPVGTNVYEQNIGFPLPEFHLSVSNQFIFVLSEGNSIVDFVLCQDFGTYVNIDDELMGIRPVTGISGVQENAIVAQLWNTNRAVNNLQYPTDGILKQIDVALGNQAVDQTTWKAYLDDAWRGQDKAKSIAAFRKFINPNMGGIGGAGGVIGMDGLRMQAPFCPTRKFIRTCTWQANDPLVHYHVGDLMVIDPANPGTSNVITEAIVPPRSTIPTNMTLATLGACNGAYAPWGGNPNKNSDPINPTDPNARNLQIKDPGVRSSDDWEFPHGKFAGLGWLGRVHRGTPWQTIYFKPGAADTSAWRQQSSDCYWYPTNGDPAFLYVRTHPTNDWFMADIFTTATDPNATRGLLSINQTNYAAWSAVLAGAVVLTNFLSDDEVLNVSTNQRIQLREQFIQPAGNYDPMAPPPLVRLVDAINSYRRTLPNETFTNLGQLLQVPELTVNSPWLQLTPASKPAPFQQWFGLNDIAYEWLPQQMLSLVKPGDSRFVVYAYGQSLKPARDSIDTSRGNICTNYQVTAEVAARAVFRVEGFHYLTNGPVITTNVSTVLETFNILPPD